MSYVPNATDVAEPTEARKVESAALEFRTLKTQEVRGLRFPAADLVGNRGELPTAANRAGRFLAFDSITGVPIVGPLLTAWTITQLEIASIDTVAASIADVNIVAGNIANINAVAADAADIGTVAANVADVVAVGDNIASVVAVAANEVNINAAVADLPALAAKVSKTGDTMTGDLIVPSLNGGQLAGMRNKIMNGKMEVAQLGASFVNVTNTARTLDRFQWNSAGITAQVTVSQSTDAPDTDFQYSLRATVTTADASIAAEDAAAVYQAIEGFDVRGLIGKPFVLSFWVRSSKTGVHCASFHNSNSDRSFVTEYTINAANTWEFKTVSVPAGLITAGTWNWGTGAGLQIRWSLAVGTTRRTGSPNSWQVGEFWGTANQVNCLDTIGNIFAITGIQLERGTVVTPFEHRPRGFEKSLCERYFEVGQAYGWGYGAAGNTRACFLRWRVEKRVAPTLAFSSVTYGNASALATEFNTTDKVGLIVNVAGTGAYTVNANFTADAEF